MQFNVQFKQTDQKIPIQFNSENKRFEVNFQALQTLTARPEVDYYEGNYEVIPKVSVQTLETKEKFLTENITVCEIPYFDVSNTAGGSTVYIGKEVEFYGS